MNRIVLAAFAAAASTLATGCPLAPGCGGFTGQSDTVYQRGNDVLIVCGNGGYSATLAGATKEGRSSGTLMTDGPTAAIIGTFATLGQGASSVTAFGLTDWTSVALDQTALDHADVMCTDLESRAWWTTATLPANTKFARVASGFATVDACIAAQANGTFSPDEPCQDELDLCANGTAIVTAYNAVSTTTYAVSTGALSVQGYGGLDGFDASYFANGELRSNDQVMWSTAQVSPQAVSKCAL